MSRGNNHVAYRTSQPTMHTLRHSLILATIVAFLGACSAQSRYTRLGDAYPARPADAPIEVFQTGEPSRPFVRIARLDAHFEKTHWMGSDLDDAMVELKKQARVAGADAIIDIKERTSRIAETRIYHVTATAIRFEDGGH
jgi:hypothetical protein